MFDSVLNFLLKIFIWLVVGLYDTATAIFRIFLILADGQLIDGDDYNLLITNFYVVLGVVMLFIIAFALLKFMVNPDDANKGTANIKKMIINLITSSIILVLLPTIFEFAFDFQRSVLIDTNVIGKFFGLGSADGNSGTNNKDFIKQGSFMISNSVWTAFFNAAEDADTMEALTAAQNEIKCGDNNDTLASIIQSVQEGGKFREYTKCAENVRNDEITFNWFLALIAGGFLLYVAISYTLDMGVRLVKLVFYQMIAPIPIFMRIIPEGKWNGMFNQWTKITLTCYLEVFIRIFILYFCIYLCVQVNMSSFFNTLADFSGLIRLLTKACVFMGIVAFMRQAPKLLSEITGIDSGNMKLGIREKLAQGGAFTAGALVGGGLTSGIRNFTNKIDKNKWAETNNLKGMEKLKARAKLVGGAAKKGGTWASVAAGVASGGVRAGKAGWNAKSEKDMKSSAASGAAGAVEARNRRSNYRAAHSHGKGFWDDLRRTTVGHISDLGSSVENFAMDESIEGLTRKSNNMGKIVSKYSTFSDTIEHLLEKEQAKGDKSVFLDGGGFDLGKAYTDFDAATQALAEARARFNSGVECVEYIDENGETRKRKMTAEELRRFEGTYTAARDAVRDKLMDMALAGANGADYQKLTAKGKAVLKDSLVNAESLQATVLENADSAVVQNIMGLSGNRSLQKIVDGGTLTVDDFKHKGTKLKDAAKVAQGEADIKIAEMNKEQAAKGDKK